MNAKPTSRCTVPHGVLSPIAALLAAFAAPLFAQSPAPPTQYTVTVVNSLMGPPVTMTIYRDGSKAVMDHYEGAQVIQSALRSRQVIDLGKGTTISWNLPDSSGGCGTGKFSGDW